MARVGKVPPHAHGVGVSGIDVGFDSDPQGLRRSNVNLVREGGPLFWSEPTERDTESERTARIGEVPLLDRGGELRAGNTKSEVDGPEDARLPGVIRPNEDEVVPHIERSVR
jgi:hypothetical protein